MKLLAACLSIILSSFLFPVEGYAVVARLDAEASSLETKCGSNEVWSDCGANPNCQKTCENYGSWETIPCTRSRKCIPGCVCDEGYALDEKNECIWQNRCPRVRH